MAGPIARLYATLGLDAREFAGGIQGAQATIQRLGGNAQVAGAAIGAGMGTAAIAALRLGESYDKAMDTIRIGTGATGDALKGLESDFKAVAGRVPDDIGVIGQVIADLNTRTGQTGEGLQALAEQMLDLSRLTGTDAAGNVASMTRLFGDWSVASEDQAAALDKVFRASQATGIGVDALAQQMVQFGAPLRNIGFEFSDATAMLAKWEKEGVNTTLALGGLKQALGKFAKEGIDVKEGLEDLIDQIVNAESATEAMALGVAKFGSRAGPDMVAAIREGRFAFEDLVDVVDNGTDTIATATQDTEGLGEAWRQFKNVIAVTVGPITKDLAGIASEMGNLVFLLPALGGALGKGLGAVWQKLGMSAVVKRGVMAAGAAAGVIYAKAAIVVSKLAAVLAPAWVAMGSPGASVIAAASAAGRAAGMAYAAGLAAGIAGGALAAIILAEATKDWGSAKLPDVKNQANSYISAFSDRWNEETTHAAKTGRPLFRFPWEAGGMFGGAEGPEKAIYQLRPGLRGAAIGLMASMSDAVEDAAESEASGMNAAVSGALIGAFAGAITTPINEEMLAARAAIAQGFGSLKEALKKGSMPQLISRGDRIENMEARQRKVYKQLHRAVQADDPYNVAYWSKAAIKAQHQLDTMKGKSKTSTSDIRRKFERMGVDIDDTWLDTRRNAVSEAQRMASSTKAEADGIKSHFDSIDFTSTGLGWMLSLAAGIRSGIPAVSQAASLAAATASASANSRGGGGTGGGGGTTIMVSGHVINTGKGYDGLSRNINRRAGLRSRGPMRYQQDD